MVNSAGTIQTTYWQTQASKLQENDWTTNNLNNWLFNSDNKQIAMHQFRVFIANNIMA